jgi:hypothetical protein
MGFLRSLLKKPFANTSKAVVAQAVSPAFDSWEKAFSTSSQGSTPAPYG